MITEIIGLPSKDAFEGVVTALGPVIAAAVSVRLG